MAWKELLPKVSLRMHLVAANTDLVASEHLPLESSHEGDTSLDCTILIASVDCFRGTAPHCATKSPSREPTDFIALESGHLLPL